MHLSIFISVINQLDAQKFCFTVSLFHASTCFEHMCSKHVEARNKLTVKQKFCASSWLITEINISSWSSFFSYFFPSCFILSCFYFVPYNNFHLFSLFCIFAITSLMNPSFTFFFLSSFLLIFSCLFIFKLILVLIIQTVPISAPRSILTSHTHSCSVFCHPVYDNLVTYSPASLTPGKRPGAHCTGGWVGPPTGLNECGISRLRRNSILGSSSP